MTSRFFHHDSRSRRLPSLSLTHMDFTCLMIIGDYTRNKNKNTLGRVTPNITRNFVTKCHQYIQNSDLVTLNHPLPRCFVPQAARHRRPSRRSRCGRGPCAWTSRRDATAKPRLCCVDIHVCIDISVYIYIYVYKYIYIYIYKYIYIYINILDG